jgi:type IX secretion system PorP/SprF family membrane protein
MKKILPLGILLLAALNAWCQQDPLYSQYLFNPFILNPAYAGYSKDLTALAAYRKQWTGFDGAPVTMNATGHIALLDNRMGLGLTVLQDEIGTDKTTQALMSYAYHLLLNNNQKISFGLRGGMVNYKGDYSSLTIDETDPKFQNNISEFKPSVGAGIIYSSDKIFAGLSVPNLLKATTTVDGSSLLLYSQHAYLHLMYVLPVSARLKVKPFVLARAVQGSPVNFDFGASLSADDSYTIGLFTRSMNTYGFLAKLHVGDVMRIGYIFELPTNKSVGTSYTTHEFTIGVRMSVMKFHDLTAVADF